MKRSRILLLILMLCPICLVAQQVVSSTGMHAVGASAQLSWTLGETMIETLTSPNSILTQGFHQGKLTVTAVGPIIFPVMKISVYPNPVKDNLLIETGNTEDKKFYSLNDINSRLIIQGNVETNPQPIEMGTMAPGVYFLKIGLPKKNSWQVFRIVKQ